MLQNQPRAPGHRGIRRCLSKSKTETRYLSLPRQCSLDPGVDLSGPQFGNSHQCLRIIPPYTQKTHFFNGVAKEGFSTFLKPYSKISWSILEKKLKTNF